jgi:DNA polymerase-3 subunit alpha
MAALMSVFKADTDKVALYIVDCRRMGIEVLPPDVNAGGLDFEIEDRPGGKAAIRFGLAAIKNVGVGPVHAVLEARERGGAFADVEDFARRVDLRLVGKRALECLARVGALDSLCPRCNLLDAVDRLISLSTAHFRAAEVGQLSLFGGATGVSERLEIQASGAGVSVRQQLTWEKELLGVYISDHPLTPYLETLTQVVTHFSAELGEAQHGEAVTVAGEVSHLRPYQTRTGKAMGFITLEDLQGSIELVVFSRVWADVSRWLTPGSIVLVRGKVDSERGDPKVLADEITREFTMVRPARPAPSAALPAADELPAAGEAWSPEQVIDAWSEAELVVAAPAEPDSPMPRAGAGDPPAGEPWTAAAEPAFGANEAQVALTLLTEQPLAEAGGDPRMITLRLHSTGDRERDARRMRRVHGLLTSYPGRDHFVFHVYEASRRYHLEFPNSTTGYCADLRRELLTLLGEGSVQVERLRIQ